MSKVEPTWVGGLRKLLQPPDEEWFGILTAFVADLMGDEYGGI